MPDHCLHQRMVRDAPRNMLTILCEDCGMHQEECLNDLRNRVTDLEKHIRNMDQARMERDAEIERLKVLCSDTRRWINLHYMEYHDTDEIDGGVEIMDKLRSAYSPDQRVY